MANSPPFTHKRGLRQGDPISPYLFILAADVFQRMTAAISAYIPYPLTNKLSKPVITFQYADDTIIVLFARAFAIKCLLITIHVFTAASGLKVNLAKSSFVPLSVPHHQIQAIEQLLRCKKQSLPIIYLGMPLTLKTPTRQDFASLLEKLEGRLEGWKARYITRAGRLQLVKSVLSSIPSYFMSCFLLPKWLLNRIDIIRKNFLWNRDGLTTSAHLLNWQTVCLPIRNGGLGIVNLHLQNLSLLLRWLWRFFTAEDKLWSMYTTDIYAPRLTSDGPRILTNNGSFFWQTILRLKPLFHSCAQFQLASGWQTSFWFDPWAGQAMAMHMQGRLIRRSISVEEAKVSLNHLLPMPLTLSQHEAYLKLLHFTPHPGRDKLVWTISPSGLFTVKSIYTILSQAGRTASPLISFWKARVTPSMKLFFFFLLNNRLLTHEIMHRRHLPYQPGCVLYRTSTPETSMHIFFLCPFSQRIWSALSARAGFNFVQPNETPSSTYLCSAPADRDCRRTWMVSFISATWQLWRERNNRTFRQQSLPDHILLNKIQDEATLCLKYC